MGTSCPAQTLASRAKVAPRVSLVFLSFFFVFIARWNFSWLTYAQVTQKEGFSLMARDFDESLGGWIPLRKEISPWKVDDPH